MKPCNSNFLPCLWDGLPPGSIDTVGDLFMVMGNVIRIMMALTGYLSVLFIIIGGIMYITSSGDPGRINTAKSTIFYAVVGLLLSLAAIMIVTFVSGQF